MRVRVGRILLLVALSVVAIGLGHQVGQAQSGGATFTFYDLSGEQEEAIRAEWATVVEWMTSEYELPEPRTQFAIGQTLDSVRHLIPESEQGNFCARFTGGRLVIINTCEHRGSLVGWYAVQQGIGGTGDHFVEEHHVHRGPIWLSWALGEYLDSKFAAADGASLEVERERRQFTSPSDWNALREFEDPSAFWSSGLLGRDLAWLAVDWLVQQADEESYIKYFTLRGEHRTWREAFLAWFGLTPAQFYARFANERPEIERIVTGATDQEADAADREGIWLSTPLYPGLNLIGWVEAPMSAADLFAAIPRAEIAYTWNGVSGTWSAAWRGGGRLGGLSTLRPGMGIWLRIESGAPIRWERRVALASMQNTSLMGYAELASGYNFVPWAGWQHSFAALGTDLVRVYEWDPGYQQWSKPFSPSDLQTDGSIRFPWGNALSVQVRHAGLWRQGLARWWPTRADTSDWIDDIEYWGDVVSDDQTRLREQIRDVVAFFDSEYGAVAEPETHIAAELVSAADMFADLRGANSEVYCGHADRDEILLVIQCYGTNQIDQATFAHEYFHILQHDPYNARYLTSGPHRDPAPFWLMEGGAMYASARYDDHRGHQSYEQTRRNFEHTTTRITEKLSEALVAGSNAPYILGFFASEWLAYQRGERALLEYFTIRNNHATVEETFEATFGLTLEEFYEEFAEWRAGGFQRIEDAN